MKAVAGPRDAYSKNGVRVYQWGEGGPECISVTSVRSLLGQPYALVNWKVAQIVERSMAPRPLHLVGSDEDYRRWLRDGENMPDRHTEAERGTAVHQAIELDMDPLQATD